MPISALGLWIDLRSAGAVLDQEAKKGSTSDSESTFSLVVLFRLGFCLKGRLGPARADVFDVKNLKETCKLECSEVPGAGPNPV